MPKVTRLAFDLEVDGKPARINLESQAKIDELVGDDGSLGHFLRQLAELPERIRAGGGQEALIRLGRVANAGIVSIPILGPRGRS